MPHRTAPRAGRGARALAAALTLLTVLTLSTAACGDTAPTAAARPPAGGPPGAPAAGVDSAALAWLRANAVPFATDAPGVHLDDLAPLRAMVGQARLVGLGEGTHGTREHFRMKHRIVEFLVLELGFTAFAIEATWPEANAVDRYVRTGEGDPAVLLSNLYFWTWNTEEVLALIRWLRVHNQTVPAERQVRFFGFDMQSPGTAIDTVRAFVRRVDPARAPAVDSAYACLGPYRNVGPRPGPQRYEQAASTAQTICRAAVVGVHAGLAERAAAYERASSREAYARALQSARLVVQWEDMSARPDARARSLARDQYMAENTDWLLAQLPAGSRMALWAHNYHVSGVAGAQGAHLRARHGGAYVAVGFAFGTGRLSAVSSSGGVTGTLTTLETSFVAPGSLEAYAATLDAPRWLLDARRITGAAAARPLAGPLPMRSIGAVYDPTRPSAYFVDTRLPADFDLLVYFRDATASRRLPFRFE